MIEVCLNIEPFHQPSPTRNPGGDCFACALAAALRWLYPDAGVSFDDAFDFFTNEYHDPKAQPNLERLRAAVGQFFVDGDVDALHREHALVLDNRPKTTTSNVWGRGGMEKALHRAAIRYGDSWGDLDVQYDIIDSHFEIETWSHAWFGQEPAGEWARRLERWLRSGFLALAEQRYDGAGPYDSELRVHSTDHFVLIDGVRLGWEPSEYGGSTWNEYAHVVCSVRGGYWIGVRDLMRKHGTAGLMLVRRNHG